MFSFISLNLAQDQFNDSLLQKKDTATATLKTAPKTGKTDDAYFHWETPVLAPVNIDSIQQQKNDHEAYLKNIEAMEKHRVKFTSLNEPTIWFAVFY